MTYYSTIDKFRAPCPILLPPFTGQTIKNVKEKIVAILVLHLIRSSSAQIDKAC